MKFFLLPLLLIFLGKLSFAQVPQWAWAYSPTASTGAGTSANNFVATDASGNLYVGGTFYYSTLTFGSTVLTNTSTTNTADVYVVKFSPSGSVLWAVSAGGAGHDVAYGMALDASGNIYMTGGFRSAPFTFGTSTINNTGTTTEDIFLLKFNSTGSPAWAVSAGGAGNDRGLAVTTDINGNILIAGSFATSSISFGSTTLTNSGSDDFFIAKYNSSGTATWAASAGGAGAEKASWLATDASGNMYIGGTFSSASFSIGTSTLSNAGGTTSTDVFVAKYAGAGTSIWASSGGGSGNENAFRLAVDASGNTYLVGSFGSTTINFGSTTLTNTGGNLSTDGYIAKYSAAGTLAWAQAVSGGAASGLDHVLGVAVNSAGNAVITGGFSGSSINFGSTTLTNPAPLTTELFVAEYTSAGTAIWAVAAGGSENDAGHTVAFDNTGGVYIGAHTCSPTASFGNLSVTGTPANNTNKPMYAKLGPACTSAPAQPGNITGATAACSGSNQTYSVAAVTGASSYNWTLPTGWIGTSSTNTITATAGTTGGNITVAAVNACGTSTAQTFSVTVSPGPSAAITAAGPVSFCQGGSVVLNATSGTGLTYQWKLNGINITGATNAAYTANAPGSYTVMVSNSSCSSTSSATVVTVNPLPTPTIAQAGMVLSTAAGQGTYQWYKNTAIIPGASSNSYTVTQNGTYYVTVSNANNCTGQSNSINITSISVKDLVVEQESTIYPNPSDGRFTLVIPVDFTGGELSVTDLNGRIVSRQIVQPGTREISVQLPRIAQGLYIIEVHGEGELLRAKLLIR